MIPQVKNGAIVSSGQLVDCREKISDNKNYDKGLGIQFWVDPLKLKFIWKNL